MQVQLLTKTPGQNTNPEFYLNQSYSSRMQFYQKIRVLLDVLLKELSTQDCMAFVSMLCCWSIFQLHSAKACECRHSLSKVRYNDFLGINYHIMYPLLLIGSENADLSEDFIEQILSSSQTGIFRDLRVELTVLSSSQAIGILILVILNALRAGKQIVVDIELHTCLSQGVEHELKVPDESEGFPVRDGESEIDLGVFLDVCVKRDSRKHFLPLIL